MSDSAADTIRLVLVGATGRMGGQILRELPRMPQLCLTGAVASEHSGSLGRDAGEHAGTHANGVRISGALAPLLAQAQLVVDFSVGTAVERTLADCMAARVPLLIGTTAMPSKLNTTVQAAARHMPVLVAPNTSLALNVLLELVGRAARVLPGSYDIEVLETHHRHKLDAPSGSALALGEAAAQARGQTLEQHACFARQGCTGARPSAQIGFAVLRGGDVVGEHQVLFLGEGESLTLGHRVSDRSVFARGALLAGQWLAHQPPGRYVMRDYLAANIEENTTNSGR